MLRSMRYRSFDDTLQKWLKRSRFLKHMSVTRELYLLFFFLGLFLILLLRLFILQVVNHSYYDQLLNQQHVSETSLKAKR